MSGTPGAELPRLKGRGRIAPSAAAPLPPPPSPPWGPRLRRLGIAALLLGALALAWGFRARIGGAAPLLARKLEAELGGLLEAFGKLLAGIRTPGVGPAAPDPTGPTGATGPSVPGSVGRPGPDGAYQLAGPAGKVLAVGDLLADLRPGSRYRVEAGGLEIHEGGALLRFPRAGARVRLRGGFELAGGPGLAEVRIDPDANGTIDAMGDPVRVRGPEGPETRVLPLERFHFPDPDSETYPEAEAETFLKRSAWLAAGKAGNPRLVAQDLARRSFDQARGTEREGLARHLLELATAWTAPAAERREGTF